MDILKVAGFGLIATVMILMVGGADEKAKTFSMMIRIVTVSIFLIFIVLQLKSLFEIIRALSLKIKMDDTYLSIILKVIGIAYIGEFGYQLCKDAGEEAIGNKVQLAGKVMIFVIASPVILAFIEMVTKLL